MLRARGDVSETFLFLLKHFFILGRQRRMMDSLELELQMVVNTLWVLGTELGSSPTATSVLDC